MDGEGQGERQDLEMAFDDPHKGDAFCEQEGGTFFDKRKIKKGVSGFFGIVSCPILLCSPWIRII